MNEFEYIGKYVLRLVMIFWMRNMLLEVYNIVFKMVKDNVMAIVAGIVIWD
jgi:hypothetical protein